MFEPRWFENLIHFIYKLSYHYLFFVQKKEKLNKRQLDNYNELFNALDTNKDGLITPSDLVNIFKTFKPNDSIQNYSINFNEFIRIIIKNENNNLDLEEAFKLFDLNQDGLLSMNELQIGLENIGEHVNMEELKVLVKPFVQNVDQQLNYDGKCKIQYYL